jgi:hypothetical protein
MMDYSQVPENICTILKMFMRIEIYYLNTTKNYSYDFMKPNKIK